VAEAEAEESPGRPGLERPLRVLPRMLAFARPQLGLLFLIVAFTLLFSAGRYGRAYLMKPLLDGVLLPVVASTETGEAPSGAASGSGEEAPGGWLDGVLADVLPDSLGAERRAGSDAARDEGPGARAAASASDMRSVRAAFAQLLLAALVIVIVTPLALVIVIVTPLALFGRAWLTEYVLGRIHLDLQRRTADALLAMPLEMHRSERSGDLLSRAQNDAQAAREVLKLAVQEFTLSAAMIGIGVLTLLYISWPLTLISLVAAPLIVGVLTGFGRRIRRSARRRQEQLGEVTQRLVSILAGIKVIKAFGGERAEARAFAGEARKLFRHDMRVVGNRVFSRAVVEALNSAAGIAMLAIGAVLVLQGRWGLSTGDVAAFATVLATTYKPIKNLAKGWGKLMEHLAAGERFLAVLDAPTEPADAADALPLEGVREGIAFSHVDLDLPGETGALQPILRDVCLDVRPGEVLAVVGRTGSGKTTLMDLLLRFHDPSGGAISIDGRDLRDWTRQSLLAQIAIVTQEPFLFDATIRDNIRYGRPDASDEDVQAAARAAHVDEFVDLLPLGDRTPVGEFGVRLSGGQRQRITIARALLKRSAILIFDEATSALDSKTERIVQDAIESLRGERTIFLVAHRLSTIALADRVVVLERGRVLQVGPHAELVAADGLYRELVSLQQGQPGDADALSALAPDSTPRSPRS
jgi:subfamily B ATP-binding cassette protein MsbA